MTRPAGVGLTAIGLAIPLAIGLATTPARADVCLAPAQIGDFVDQSSLAGAETFQARLAANPPARGCTETEAEFCPAPAGLFAVWSNNASAYWFGPLGPDDTPRRIHRRLAGFSEALRSIEARGDYRDAGHHFIIARTAECFPKSSRRGAVNPQLLFDLGRETLRLEGVAARLTPLVGGIADAAGERAAAGSADARARLAVAADRLAGEAWRDGLATLEGGETPRPLGRIGDGLLHLALHDGRAGAALPLDAGFARWLGDLLGPLGDGPDPLRERLAPLVWMAHPEPFDLLFDSAAGAADGNAFDAIAARYAARDARLGLAQAFAEGGTVARALADLELFRSSIPELAAARLESLPMAALFALADDGGPPPDLAGMQDLLTGTATRDSIEAETVAEARRLGRVGLAAAATAFADGLGIALDGETAADRILSGDHAGFASDMLRAALSGAFLVENGGDGYVESLAQGDYEAFATRLLAGTIGAGLAGRQVGEEVAPAMARALLAGDPVTAWQRLALAAAADVEPAWRGPLGLLADGRGGDGVRATILAGLEAEGVATPLATRLIETGDAAPLLDAALARKAGLPPAEIGRLAAGTAPEHVRRRAADMLAPPARRQELFEALTGQPEATVDALRRESAADLLAALAPDAAARPAALAALADPLARQPVAAALLGRAVGGAPLAAGVFPPDALAALVEGRRDAAIAPSIGPLLAGVPGSAALLAGDHRPFRDAVGEALRVATASAAGEETAERLLAGSLLDALEEGDLAGLGRGYAGSLLAAAGLAPQSVQLLLAGRIDEAWLHEASVRAREPGVDRQLARTARTVWRAAAAQDLARFAQERRLRVHGLAREGLSLREEG